MGIVFNLKIIMKKILFFNLLLTVFFFSDVFSQQDNSNSKNNIGIIIYGSDECHHCLETKQFLKEKNIAFVFYDIDKDPVALREMLTKLRNADISTSNLGIPVVDKKGVLFSNNGDFKEFLKKLE